MTSIESPTNVIPSEETAPVPPGAPILNSRQPHSVSSGDAERVFIEKHFVLHENVSLVDDFAANSKPPVADGTVRSEEEIAARNTEIAAMTAALKSPRSPPPAGITRIKLPILYDSGIHAFQSNTTGATFVTVDPGFVEGLNAKDPSFDMVKVVGDWAQRTFKLTQQAAKSKKSAASTFTCQGCRKVKPLESFTKHPSLFGRNLCKPCEQKAVSKDLDAEASIHESIHESFRRLRSELKKSNPQLMTRKLPTHRVEYEELKPSHQSTPNTTPKTTTTAPNEPTKPTCTQSHKIHERIHERKMHAFKEAQWAKEKEELIAKLTAVQEELLIKNDPSHIYPYHDAEKKAFWARMKPKYTVADLEEQLVAERNLAVQREGVICELRPVIFFVFCLFGLVILAAMGGAATVVFLPSWSSRHLA